MNPHATRVQNHVLKIPNLGISICRALIPTECVERYQNLYNNSVNKRAANKRARSAIEDSIIERQEAAIKRIDDKTVDLTVPNQPSIDVSVTNHSQGDIRKSNNTKLQMAIADLWHCENFPDRAVESTRFKLVIRYAKLVGNDFKIPRRKSIGGPLLDLNFKSCYEQNKAALMQQVSYCGAILFWCACCFIVNIPHYSIHLH